jgi:ankyrin repeat protein
MLHVAAQGDCPPPIYLFSQLGLDINSKDSRGSTPLHWACYSYSELTCIFLLSLKPDVNTQDQDGFSPLHLAVRKYTQD